MAIALSHGGTTIYSSPAPSNEVLVGTKEGIVFIKRDAQGWRVADRALTDKHISAIVLEPESGLIFASAFKGSLHVSADGGKTWEQRDNGLTQDDVYCISEVKVDGKVHLYAGSEPAYLFSSDDLGLTWTELPSLRSVDGVTDWTFPAPPHIAHAKHVNFAPGEPTTVYASVEVGALLKSTDSGQTWQDLKVPYPDIHRTVINPQDGNRIYVTGGDGLYSSADGGVTWEHWTMRDDDAVGGYPDTLVLHPRQPELMFMGAAHHQPGAWRESHSAGARISRSRDGGRTWEHLGEATGLPDRFQSSVEAMCLEDAGDALTLFAATTGGEVWSSEDAGDHWALIISGLAPISKSGHYRVLQGATT